MQFMDRFGETIPGWLAWPLSAASVVTAAAGAALIFTATALGSVQALIGAVAFFAAAGLLWYGADYAQGNREPG